MELTDWAQWIWTRNTLQRADLWAQTTDGSRRDGCQTPDWEAVPILEKRFCGPERAAVRRSAGTILRGCSGWHFWHPRLDADVLRLTASSVRARRAAAVVDVEVKLLRADASWANTWWRPAQRLRG